MSGNVKGRGGAKRVPAPAPGWKRRNGAQSESECFDARVAPVLGGEVRLSANIMRYRSSPKSARAEGFTVSVSHQRRGGGATLVILAHGRGGRDALRAEAQRWVDLFQQIAGGP